MKNIIPILLVSMITQIGSSQTLIPYRLGNQWGYANEKGEMVIKPKYQKVGEFRDELTWVKKNDKFGYINKKGKKKTGFKFEEANYFGFGTARVRKGKEKYCINERGRKSNCRSGCVGVISIRKGFQTYRKGDKIGMLKYDLVKNNEGKTVQKIDSLPAIWEEFKENQKGYAGVRKDSLWGIINEKGEMVVDYIYDRIDVHPTAFKINKFFRIKQNGKYGFLNDKGELVVQPKYHRVEFIPKVN